MRGDWHNEPPRDDTPRWFYALVVGPVVALFLILMACLAVVAIHGTWTTITSPDTPDTEETP